MTDVIHTAVQIVLPAVPFLLGTTMLGLLYGYHLGYRDGKQVISLPIPDDGDPPQDVAPLPSPCHLRVVTGSGATILSFPTRPAA